MNYFVNTYKKTYTIVLLLFAFTSCSANTLKKLENENIIKIGLSVLLEPIIKTILKTIISDGNYQELSNTYTDKFIQNYIHVLEPNKQIKLYGITNLNSPMAATTKSIYISADYFSTLERILTNKHAYEENFKVVLCTNDGQISIEDPHKPTTEELEKIHECEFLISHELGHIKHNDVWKSLAISLIKGIINYYAYNKLLSGRKDSLKNTALAASAAIGITALSETICQWFPSIWQEKVADAHACTTLKELYPKNYEKNLRVAQELFKANHLDWEKALSDPKIFLPNIDGFFVHKTLYILYKLSGSQEPFMLWLKEKNPTMYTYIFMRAEPTHPTPMARIKAIEDFIAQNS